ncbi:MAG: amidohydrolase, partial [Gaiellaceae bacterium]
MHRAAVTVLCALGLWAAAAQAAELPIFDAHVHFSHDAAAQMPVKEAAAILRKAGLKRALVSSSGDAGTQALLAEAPDIVVPSLRPYRTRGELSTWSQDDSVVGFLEDLLKRHRYAAIGEFHLYGADADRPVPRRMVALASQHGLVLHAHADVEAIERLFVQDPRSRILWAHSGFERPEQIAALLRKHQNLWCDLAFR